ncbi:hypothetical protein D1AOALGA4SA_4668 [Olavius algarvensis Delta 1 endosymbiont]|nr:hypothetical protein D1AOALGA4SA_4668 [Olavius algarvensis Delta 1 endosymbiont]
MIGFAVVLNLRFENWDLFVICNLRFVIYTIPIWAGYQN